MCELKINWVTYFPHFYFEAAALQSYITSYFNKDGSNCQWRLLQRVLKAESSLLSEQHATLEQPIGNTSCLCIGWEKLSNATPILYSCNMWQNRSPTIRSWKRTLARILGKYIVLLSREESYTHASVSHSSHQDIEVLLRYTWLKLAKLPYYN